MSSHRSRRPANSAGDDDDTRQSSIKQRRSQAISLNSFSTKRGHDRAIEEFKKRKETRFRKNATLLREYSKAMKSEGYDVGRGASRKRNFDGAAAEQDSSHQASGVEKNSHERKKRHKSDPLKAARQKAQYLKEAKIEIRNEKEQRKLEEEKKVQNRKKRAKKMMERTRKGQPLMKNIIGDLLGKIRSDCEADDTGDH
eukprot:scaffold63078_cov66-Cyclotella_meneghiniana.AAC.2